MSEYGYQPERRHFGRRKIILDGLIIAPCRPKIMCLVRDLSHMGGMLEVNPKTWLPARFRLIVAGSIDVDCDLVHRAAGLAGVRFLAPLPALPEGFR